MSLTRSFLVGCPRSGTTLLQAFLAAHPAIQGFPESHMFQFAYEGPAGRIARARRVRAQLLWFARTIGRTLGLRVPPLVSPAPDLRRFLRLLDDATAESGREAWVEKTPDHVLYIPEIEQHVPGARFVHLVRDGRAVVASLFEVGRRHPDVWGTTWTLENCVAHWNRCLRATIRAVDGHEGHLAVRYEDLIGDPRSILGRICAFLDLEFREEMLTGYVDAAEAFVTAEERAWKREISGELSDPGLSKNERLFAPEERRRIEASLDPVPESLFV